MFARYSVLFLLATTLLVSLQSLAAIDVSQYEAQGWELKKSSRRNNVYVFLRQKEGYDLKSFLAVTELDARLESIIALFNDVENVSKWVHRVRQMEILKRVSETEMYQYSVTDTPPPAADRDMVLRSWVEQDPLTKTIEIRSEAVEGFLPEQRGRIRMTDVHTYWRLIPQADGKIRVEFEGYGDPAGLLPDWLVNMVLHQSPYFTLKRMSRILKKPKYRDTTEFSEYAVN